MTSFLYRLGRAAIRRRRLTLLVWAIVAVGVIAVAQAGGGETSDRFEIPGVEAQRALDVLEEDFPSAAGTSAQLVFAVEDGGGGSGSDITLSDPDAARAIDAALADVAAQPDVGNVGELQRSPDDRIGYADVQYDRPSEDIRDQAYERLEATADATNQSGVVQMELGGDLPTEAAQEPPEGQEIIGLVVAVIVLLVAFGSVIAMGLPIGLALVGLAIAGITAVTVMGLMAGLTVAVMVAIALTLLPALLGFAGHRIDALRVPGLRGGAGVPGRESMWHRWGRQVSAHPWRYLVGGVLALGLLAAPVFSMRLGMTDNGTSPSSMTTRRAYDLLADGFGPGFNGPLVMSVELDGATVDDLAPLESAIAADPGVQAVAPAQANDDGTAAVLRVIPTSAPQYEDTTDLVHRLRDGVIPQALSDAPGAEVHVGGQTALFIDMSDKISSRLLWFIGAVILLSVVLLMMVFRSVAVPLKAAVMNLLSIGAAYGVIVAVVPWGWVKGPFGGGETVPIVSFMPMMLFAVLFGLSMDYEVFLLSRVREEYLHRRDNDSAVIEGISATARVITSAALIMISVFAAFVLGDDPVIKMFGLGLATAVFIDATIVRIVLVPATMKLLGEWNWWLPGWLDRRLPNLDVEGGTGLPEPEYEPGRGPAVPTPDRVREPALAD